MRKWIMLFAILFLLITMRSFAERSGTTNTYSSWVSVTNPTLTTITFPSPTRDLYIENGSAVDVCISIDGSSFEQNCYENVASGLHDVFQLGAGDNFEIHDFITESITIRSAAGTASPVSVISTY